MSKWQRYKFMPVRPLGEDGKIVTGSKEHIALSRKVAAEGMVLLKNENRLLPLKRGSRVALFGKASVDYVKGGGGSGDVTVAYVRNLCDGMEEKAAEGYRVLAVTACPTGIAHTYMAAEALEKAGKRLGISIKVETNGSGGAKNILTDEEIAVCDGIIIAADKSVAMARFN